MGVPVRDFLKNRRDRALGTVLGYAEREVYPGLTQAQRDAFRRVTLDALNGYHDAVLDLVKAESGVRNDEVVELLTRIDQQTRQGR